MVGPQRNVIVISKLWVEEDQDPYMKEICSKYPHLPSGKVGKLKDYVVKYYADESIPLVAEPSRPIPYYL